MRNYRRRRGWLLTSFIAFPDFGQDPAQPLSQFLRMHQKLLPVLPTDTVQELVHRDYRMAAVFHRHEMAYCADGSLALLCDRHGVAVDELREELENVTRNSMPPPPPDYSSWDMDFLVKYLVKVYHGYFRRRLPEISALLTGFIKENEETLAYCTPMGRAFKKMELQLFGQLDVKEHTIYPYITRVANALNSDASYARLLVRTLRKPLADVQQKSEMLLAEFLSEMRLHTTGYSLLSEHCSSHSVVVACLRELDEQMNEYLLIERTELYPRAIQMEKRLLEEA